MVAAIFFVAGVIVGYCKEDEIADLTYEANKAKNKFVSNLDDMCDCCK